MKRTTIYALLLFCLTLAGVNSAWAQTASKWDGKNPTETWDAANITAAGITGAGTETDPYVIKDAKGFVYFWWGANNGKIGSSTQYWKLDADIDLDNKTWSYVNKNGTFKGKFDGQDHTISNMYLIPPAANLNYGLFCVVEGQAANNRAEVKNLIIDKATIAPNADLKENTSVGFVVGKSNKYADFDNVQVTNSTITYSKSITNNNFVGGIVGQTASDTKLTDCSVNKLGITTSGTTTNAYFGGMIGYIGSKTTVTGCSTTDVTITYNAIANASHISGFIGYAKGTAADPVSVNKCTVTNTKMDLKAGIKATCYIGALLGRSENCTLFGDGTDANKNTVTSPVIDIAGDINTASSYIGGAIGQFAGGSNNISKINGLTVSSPSVTINKVSYKDCYIGAVFGRVNTYSTITNTTVSTKTGATTLNYKNTDAPNVALNLGTFAGGIFGVAAKETAVTDISMTGDAQMTIGSSNDVKAIKAGIVGQSTTNVRLEDWTIENTSVQISGSLTDAASNIGGFIGYLSTATNAPVKLTNTKITRNSTVSVSGNVSKASQLGGFVGYMIPADAVNNQLIISTAGVDGTTTVSVGGAVSDGSHLGGFVGQIAGRTKAGNEVKLEHISMGTANVSITGAVSAASYFGGLIGLATTNVKLNDLKVTTAANITMSGDINTAASYVGGAVGQIIGAANYASTINGLNVTKPSVTIDKVSIANSYIGAVIGYANTFCTISNVNVSAPTLTYNNNGAPNVALFLGSFAGGILGTAGQEAAITDVNITGNAQLTIGNNNDVKSIKAGIIGQASTNVRLQDWTIAQTAVQINGNLATTASNIGGFMGYAVSAENAPTKLKNIKITGSSSVGVSGNISVASFVGGAIGDCLGVITDYNVIDGMTVTSPTVTLNKVDIKDCYIGSVFGRINTYNNVNAITASNPTLKYNYTDNPNVALNLGTFAGGITGIANYETPVTNVTINGTAQLTISTDANKATTKVGSVKAGLVGVATKFARLEHWTIETSNVQIYGDLVTTASKLGGVIADVVSDANAPTAIKDIKVTGSTSVNVTGDISIASYVGGVIGDVTGVLTHATVFDGMDISSPSVSIYNCSVASCYIGSVFSRIQKYNEVNNVTVSNPILTYDNASNSNVALLLGTFAGYIAGEAATKETPVTKVTINGTAQLTIGTDANKSTIEAMNIKAGLIGQATTNVRLEGWTIANSNVKVYGKLTTTGSQIGAFAGNLTGAANAPAIVSAKITGSSNINVTGDITVGSYLGGFIGQATTNVRLEDCEVKEPTVKLEGGLKTATSYVGGAFGYFLGAAGNTSYIDGLTVTDPKVNIVSVADKEQYVGSVFGRINTYANINDVTAANPKLAYSAVGSPNIALYLGTFAGYLTGVKEQENLVTNVKITGNAELTIGTDADKATTNISNVRAGLLGIVTTNVRLENWSVANTGVQVYGNLTTSTDYFGGFAGHMESGTNTPLTLKNDYITGNSTINVTGNIIKTSYLGGFAGDIVSADAITSYVNIDGAGIDGTSKVSVGGDVTTETSYGGGFAGYMQGRSKDGNYFKADNVSIGTTDLAISGQITKASYFGGIVGRATTSCAFSNWKIKTASKLTFNDNITDLSYIGGAIGSLEGASGYPATVTGFEISSIDITLNCNLTKGIYVGGLAGQMTAIATTPNKIEKSSVSGKIHVSDSHTYTNGDIPYTFGGVVGYLPQTSSTFSEVNNCVSEVDFDLSELTPAMAGNMYSGLVVGGVVGRINTPSRLPESLYYSGKIYAPTAAVGPAVGVFVTKVADNKYIYDDYTGVNATAISADEWAKANDWYYNDYKIGVSSALTGQTMNTTESPEGGYLAIGKETLTNANHNSTANKISKTILAYAAVSDISPAWTTNKNTYPAHYMYYMQGVNRGVFVEDELAETTKDNVLSGTLTILTLKDANANDRGVIAHTLMAEADGVDSYKWYVDGELQSVTSANFNFKPDPKGNTIAVEAIKSDKALKKVDIKVKSVFRVNDTSAETYGTKTNPYLIGSADELQLLSYLSTLPLNTPWEKTYTSDNHYNKAYYELDGDIDLSGVADFTPISFATGFVANNGMSLGYVFDGVFDGKQHKISGLKEEWYGGVINADNSFMGWGLFSVVGSPMPTVKVGDSQASPAVIRNLIIDNAQLTHRTSNTTFFYGTSGKNGGNCCIGVLAGIVQNNTQIDNIEIRNSKITDTGSSEYSLATRGLYVGGAIGSIQNAFNEEGNAPVNTKIQHIASQVDIALENPKFADTTKPEQLGIFNIGGIIGRYCATSALQAQAQVSMPSYTLYSGSINAPKAWISPVLGALRYASQQGISFANYSKIWEGNNNSDVTQINITNAQYYNFSINGELITEVYPANKCPINARTINSHTNATEAANTYNAAKYQGVNYATRFIDSNVTSLYFMNQDNTDNIYWTWDNGFPHMTNQKPNEAYLTPNNSDFTANMVEGSGDSYRWEISFDGKTWSPTDGTDQNNTTTSSGQPKLVVAIITVDGVEYRTQAELAFNVPYMPYIKQEGDDATGHVFSVDWKDLTPSGGASITYQWYHSDKTTPFEGETGSSITLTKDQLDAETGGIVWCEVKVKESGVEIASYFLSCTAGHIVVFLQLNNVTASNGITYSKSNAGANAGANDTYGVKQVNYDTATYGKIPEKPVNSWAEAYALLTPYTEPTEAYVRSHGGTWTSATLYDDEAYYLAHKEDYAFDIYKRDGKLRKAKPIDKCESNWDKNIIVVMGLSNDGYFNTGESNQHIVDGARANKPVTIMGMYNGVNYYGFHSNTSGDLSINADHKFENMGFGVSDKGIGATESVRYRIYAHRWNVHAGRGLLMGWAAALKWGPDVVPVNDANKKIYKITNADPSTGTPVGNYTADIAIMGGYLNDNTSDNPEMFEYINHGRDDVGQQIKIESGFWGPVCPGNRQTDSGNATNTYYTMGGPDHPAKTTITVDICREDNDGNEKFNSAMPASTIDMACLLSGNHEGTMYADVTLNILSGHMGRIVNGIKGAQRRQVTKPASFTTGGHYRHIINYGTKETPSWTEIAAPAPDSFFGRGILNFDPANSQNNSNEDVNSRVSVIELYCGSLGRGHNDGSYHPEVSSYFYGLSEVNIKGGTFKKTIYGAGAGGVNGIGTAENHTDDDGIPYWNTDLDPGKTRVWYAPYDYIKGNGHNYEFVKIKMMGVGSDDTNLEDGYVNMEKTRNIINITGGIFGSESSPASIYGGGFGEANASLINPSKSKNDADNIKNTYNTPNHQGGNMYGAADGLVTQINISGDAKIYGNIYGGGMGSMRYYRYFVRAGEDIVNYPNENQTYTHIMNPGGDTYSKPGGIDWQNVLNMRRNADNYLNVGQVFGNTKVTISGNVEVFGNVYGAGEGVPDMTMDEFFSSTDTDLGLTDQLSSKATILNYSGTASNGKRTAHITADDTWVAFPNLGRLYGDSKVIIDGNTHIHGNVYGGGKAGAMDGNSTVVVKSGIIDGDVFGAGEGEANRPDKAKVTGNTNVIVDSNWKEPEPTTQPEP